MRISPETISGIRAALASGVTEDAVAQQFGVSRSTVARYRHLRHAAIPAELVRAVRAEAAAGVPVAQLARRYGVSLSQCHRWLKNPTTRPDAIVLPPEVQALPLAEQELFRLTTVALMRLGGN